ncbi:Arc family DNA-binding protein [Shinella kummerowiae]|uniref:Arc family DNA-binding protein n=1 Tax=Shinella kummerowiae TaxID=417745 RepID=A0A6N8SJ46_9HYPH|nr:Arc family DNA-binding protein [Shinella kummerowiae]MXN48791.1 Arc family DNA-binding protein [Shinella kummerowiae]
MGREDPQLKLRLTEALKARVTAAAQANGRSVNAEIVAALETAFPDPAKYREELKFLDEIDEIQQRLDRIRAARLAEASESFTEEFIEENAEKIKGRPRQPKKKDH